MITYSEWARTLHDRVAKLNVSAASCVFEVGSSRTLIIFEIGGFVGSEEMRDLIDGAVEPGQDGVIYNAKPGLWALLEGDESDEPEPAFTASWVSDAHIDYDALPQGQAPLVSPLKLDGVEWSKVQGDYFNSTVGCIIALEHAQEFEGVGMDNATCTYADLGGIIPGGFIFGPYETVRHEVHIRVQNNEVVQIKVIFVDYE